jgi:hypothetical protein
MPASAWLSRCTLDTRRRSWARARVALARADYGSASVLLGRALELQPGLETARLLAEVRAVLGDTNGAAAMNARAERLGRSDRRGLSLFYSARRLHPERAQELAGEEFRCSRRHLYGRRARLGTALEPPA